jgi:uroporphyrinogen decarboxylase
VIPPRFFREFELPRLKRVFRAFSAAGSVANWLHIAGPARPILSLYPQAGVSIANFDYCVGPGEAQVELPGTCLDGNIRSVDFIEAAPEHVESEAISLINAFREHPGFLLSSGCEIPPESAPENIHAMVRAAGGRGV